MTMTIEEAKIETLKCKIRRAEMNGMGTSGCVRKWKRQVRNSNK